MCAAKEPRPSDGRDHSEHPGQHAVAHNHHPSCLRRKRHERQHRDRHAGQHYHQHVLKRYIIADPSRREVAGDGNDRGGKEDRQRNFLGHPTSLEDGHHVEGQGRHIQAEHAHGQGEDPERIRSGCLAQSELPVCQTGGDGSLVVVQAAVRNQAAVLRVVTIDRQHDHNKARPHDRGDGQPGAPPRESLDQSVQHGRRGAETQGDSDTRKPVGQTTMPVEPLHDHVSTDHGQHALPAKADAEESQKNHPECPR